MNQVLKPIPADDLTLSLRPNDLICVFSYTQITTQLRKLSVTHLYGQFEPTGTMAPIGFPLTLLHLEYPFAIVRHALPQHLHSPPFHLDLRNCTISKLSPTYLAAFTPTTPPPPPPIFGTPIHLPPPDGGTPCPVP